MLSPTSNEICQLVYDLGILLEKARVVTESYYESDELSDYNINEALNGECRIKLISTLKIYIICLMDLLPFMEDTLNYAN